MPLIKLIFNNLKVWRLLLRHGAISLLCATSEFSLFMLMLTQLKINLATSYVISFVVATLIGFVGHSMFTFKLGRLCKRNAMMFTIQACCALALGYLLISGLISSGLVPAIAKAMQLVVIFFFNVTFGKVVSFKGKSNLVERK